MKLPETILSQWKAKLAAYNEYTYGSQQDPAGYHKSVEDMLQVLFDIFASCVNGAGVHDAWEDSVDLFPFGIEATKNSRRLQTDFKFGIDAAGYYVECRLCNSSYLRHMDDAFWGDMARLPRIGKLNFEASSLPSVKKGDKQNELLFKNRVSTIYCLIRNYILLNQQHDPNEPVEAIGDLKVSWPLDMQLDEVIPRVSEAFGILYRLNYSLYRPYYQELRKTAQKLFAGLTPEQQELYGGLKGLFEYMRTGKPLNNSLNNANQTISPNM